MWHRLHSNKRGFTLIEIMIGMAIVMILTGIAIPSLSEALENAEVASLEQQLQRARTGIDFYTFQHEDQYPGLDASGAAGWSASTFREQLLLATDEEGNTAAAGTEGYFYGPYLAESFPRNPFSNLTSVHLVQPGTNFSQPNNTTGWVYWADTGVIRANTSGTTPDGMPLFDL
jgi:prepilin-type N-terminal cleavage/methylation domain-containing protein